MGKKRTWQFWLLYFLKRGALIYLGATLILTLLQRRLIYLPSKVTEEQSRLESERLGLQPWLDRSGTIIGWRSLSPDIKSLPTNRLVVFHGNAGHALLRSYYARGFRNTPESSAAWEVFLFEYPGYGARPGSPSEKELGSAARQAFRELLMESSRPVFLLGESLGSSFASRLAGEYPKSVSGLILVTPMTCLAEVAAKHYRFLPVRLILRESHNVKENLISYPGPAAFLVAGRDEIMADHLGEMLYKEYTGRKKLWVQPEATHNTLNLSEGSEWWNEVRDFLK